MRAGQSVPRAARSMLPARVCQPSRLKTNVARAGPDAAGENVKLIVQLPPAGRTSISSCRHVSLVGKPNPGSSGESVAHPAASSASWSLVFVIVIERDFTAPTFTDPKSTVRGAIFNDGPVETRA